MSDPSSHHIDLCNSFEAQLSHIFSTVFERLGYPLDALVITPSERPELGAFQCNSAMKLAKLLGKSPQDVANTIINELKDNEYIAKAIVAGPGFINLTLSQHAYHARLADLQGDDRGGGAKLITKRRVIIDYGGPNVAKPMHVGHLRTAVIGECLKRVFRFMGDEVIGDAHFGDWGFQMGLLISALYDEKPYLAYFDDTKKEDFPTSSPVTLADLERLYPLAANQAKQDEAYRDRARKATRALQEGHCGYRALWQHFVAVSREALVSDYQNLDVTFDLWLGESDADAFVGPMIEDLRTKGLLEADQGAQIIRVAKEDDSRELPPLLVISSEGSAMYGTTDLATIVQRKAQFTPDLVLYCVDKRQADHFEQVFRASHMAGYLSLDKLEHIANGTVNGTDGKPFKTREGGVLKLGDLIDQAREKAKERLLESGLGADLDQEEFSQTADMISVAAIKFAELINHRLTNYVFDLDRFMSFEGKTGPYLIYQSVRIKSILRKASDLGLRSGEIIVSDPTEELLVLTLDRFGAALAETYRKRAPNLLADHIYRLCQNFARFYAACPVLSGEMSASRLSLVALTLKQLSLGFDLLGIKSPERM